MAQQPKQPGDRWVSIGLSVLLHGALLAAVVYGWWTFRQHSRPAPTLAIEGTVVDARSVRGLTQQTPQRTASPVEAPPEEPVGPPAPQPQAPPEPEGPPPPTPEELAQRQKQEQQAAGEAAEKAAAEKAAAEKAAAAQKAAALKAAQEKAAAQRAAQVDQSAAVSDLQRELAGEEHSDSVRSSGARASWQAAIAAKITRAWLKPPTARSGIDCMLNVTQVPGGEVTDVSVGECNGDQAVRESIEAAVYRASPLPPPPDPSLFDRNLQIRFKPDQ
jgi:colicin import membrane protein